MRKANTITGVAASARLTVRAAMASLGSARTCNICGWTGHRFLAGGFASKRRPDARCPSCLSLERDRLAFYVLDDLIATDQRTLHIAPEPPTTRWLRDRSGEYLAIDAQPGRAMRAMSLTDLQLDDEAFTLVYCSHVLEHIPDDRAAMAEMRRVLAPGGLAVCLVPTHEGPTDEDESVTSERERQERFGQPDHVRFYGTDISDRLREAGFEVEVFDVDDLPADDVERSSLRYPTTRHVFLARVPED